MNAQRYRELGILFANQDLSAFLRARLNAVAAYISGIPRDQFLATSIDTLVESVLDKYSIEPLAVAEEQMQMENSETRIDVSDRDDYLLTNGRKVLVDGHQFRFFLPFSGDTALWTLRPNLMGGEPRGVVDSSRNLLTLTYSNTIHSSPEWYQQQLQQTLQSIRNYVGNQGLLVAQFNNDLKRRVPDMIAQRREQLQRLSGIAQSFNIPLTAKPGMPDFRPIQVLKRHARTLPRAPSAGVKPEPAISDDLYEEILGIIRHMGVTFEGTPLTYQALGEEGLRDILLASLNGHYKGAATGETFRKSGKTDIRIEEETRSAFVGECKLWNGEAALMDALGQLLGYLTWRDCKAALVIFNMEVAGFSGIQETIAKAPPKHPLYLRQKPTNQPGEWRFVFRLKEDPAREITVQVQCFNLYVLANRAGKKR